ncbi:lipase member H-A-like [Chrysoperla carnea]|uniref:lipase member H-A-like n=1 Tax=Chrysoperla carnea TaxID=189513 RepID=UPI001D099953|nr:lipase member H-A-like [Chrysoperla carnea]
MFAQILTVIVVLNILKQQHVVNSAEWSYSKNCVILLYETCDNSQYIEYHFISTNNIYDQPIKLDPNNVILPKTYNVTGPTKVLIHGYGGTRDQSFPEILKAYTDVPDLNIIIVNWQRISEVPCYVGALINTWHVGQCTATLLTSLLAYSGQSPEQLHLVGFSLGAHVAGITGTLYTKATNQKFARITGLDPALPLYATLSFVREWILDVGDAHFVDIIHTNAGVFGKIENTGDVDFYVNGGSAQPMCSNQSSPRLCSHFMAPVYFSESISSNVGFYGKSCPSYYTILFGQCNYDGNNELTPIKNSRIMGEHCDTRSRGIYYVKTAYQSPYALGPYE